MRETVYVLPNHDLPNPLMFRWELRFGSTSITYRRKRDAMIAARAVAIVTGAELQPHNRHGRIQDPDSYGHDPRERHG